MPSIKVLNISLVLLCIFITAFVCTFLAITSSEKALDDTKESRDVSVSAAFSVGEESVTNRTTEYMDLLMDSTMSFLAEFLRAHRVAAEGIAKELMDQPYDTIKRYDWHHWPRYFHAFADLRDMGNTGMSVTLANNLFALHYEDILTIPNPPSGYHHFRLMVNHGDDHPYGGFNRSYLGTTDGKGGVRGVTNPLTDVSWHKASLDCEYLSASQTNGTIPDEPCRALPDWQEPSKAFFMQFAGMTGGKALWTTPFEFGVGYYSLNLIAPIYHNGTLTGVATSGAHLNQLSDYLSTLTIGGPVAGYPSRGRVYLTIHDSWLSFIPGLLVADALLSASHGKTLGKATATTQRQLYPRESDDPIISGIGNKTETLGLSMEDLALSQNVTVLNIATDLAPEGEDFYYKVGRLSNKYGVDWHVHLVVDREYILGSIDKKTAETRDEISTSEQKVEDDLKASQTILYVTVVAVAVGLTVLSAVFVQILLRPLSGLMEEMVWVSAMDLDRAGSVELSSMVEVREMQVAFRKMKQNLQDFKAYVPVALLNSSNELVVVEPPSGDVAMVFTDIVRSTELWARSSSGMNTALETHNEVIREAAADHSGYEVKTIGDSFMVAFDSSHDALAFSLQVLTGLASSEWPEELGLDTHGLRVRIGCHVGHTIPEENPLTGRRDYRGSAVNLASRSEGRALPGTVCVTSDVLKIVQGGSRFSELGGPKIEDMGMQQMKGIDGERHMYLLSPFQGGNGRQAAYEQTPDKASSRGTTPIDRSSASSMSGPVSLPQANFSIQNKKTGLTLMKGNATVAVCMMVGARKDGEMFDDCNAMVRAAVEAASQTDGVVGNVTGQTLTVVWNGLKPCKLHTTSAMRFAAQLEVRAATIVRVGLATGPLLYGNVGTQKRRFNTAFGRPLDAAHAGAALASHCSTFAVLVDVSADMGASASMAVAPFVRLLDMWEDGGSRLMNVYELLCKKLMRQLEDAWGTVAENDADLEVYNMTFREAMKGESAAVEKLRLLAAMDPSDMVVKRAVEVLSKLSVDRSRTCRVQVRFSSIPAGAIDGEEEMMC